MFKRRRGGLDKLRSHGALVKANQKRKLPQIYLSDPSEEGHEIFLKEPGALRPGSRFKWLISTCIAACVGVGLIGRVMYASMDMEDGSGVINSLQKASMNGMKPLKNADIVNDKLRIASQKTDRLQATSQGLSTKHIIHDRISQKKDNRDFITVKPYAHIVASLSMTSPKQAENIPNFNPVKLYANTSPLLESIDGSQGRSNSKLSNIRIVDFNREQFPNEDGEELAMDEIYNFVTEAALLYEENAQSMENALQSKENGSQDPAKNDVPRATTILEKNVEDDVLPEQREIQTVKFKKGNTLVDMIKQVAPGTEDWQVMIIAEKLHSIIPANRIKPGDEVRFMLVPTPQDNGKLEPISVSLFSAKNHVVTVSRNGAGDFSASEKPSLLTVLDQGSSGDFPQRASVYTSIYHAALVQNVPENIITQILRIHSFDVDYKRSVQLGDKVEVFFDVKDEKETENGEPGDILFTATNIAGTLRRFYRFRAADGQIDYFDENGTSAKKFLIRKPVRGGRYASGFGGRMHPVLKRYIPHKGVDWAAPTGTPIIAAGNGIIEEVGPSGAYGNYVRIRHANGYKTAYAHMVRFAEGMRKGIKIKQGQIIGYVGTTGRSTGPHLHFEILVNNSQVDPMKVDMPEGLDLKGKQLADFQKERARIDDLMRRTPVKTHVAKVEEASLKSNVTTNMMMPPKL